MSANKTLLVVFLRGGLDGLNAVVPTFDDDYHAQRPTLALRRREPGVAENGNALPLDDRFALSAGLEKLLPHYREGRLAIVHAIGSDNTTGSHFEAQDQMEHGASMTRPLGAGWAARWLRTLDTAGALSALAFGRSVPESLRGAPSVTAVTALEEIQLRTHEGRAGEFSAALESLYSVPAHAEREHIGLLGRSGRDALALMRRLEDVRDSAASETEYPDSGLAKALAQVAQLIRHDLGLRVATVDHGGFDTHFGQALLLESRLRELAEALDAFHADLGTLMDRVTIVCVTEFGRRVHENASLGTDHGRGSCAFVLGAGVKGGRVAGRWPRLEREGTYLGPGGLEVTTDYRDLLWEILARQFGARDRETVFPGLEHRPVGVIV